MVRNYGNLTKTLGGGGGGYSLSLLVLRWGYEGAGGRRGIKQRRNVCLKYFFLPMRDGAQRVS